MIIDALYDKKHEDIKYKILLVEDSVTINDTITKSLKNNGHPTTQAFTLSQADKYIQDNDYDFIIMDLILPDGDGSKYIAKMSQEFRSKVIVLSGTEDIDKRRYVVSLGILDYFSKTTPINLIIEDIKRLIYNIVYNPYINLLIVDDAAYMRKKLHDIFVPKRYNIFLASSAKEGLDILEKEEIDILFLDYEMPEMDGADMLEAIKQDVKYFDLPVIMISSSDDEDTIARVLKHGACDFIKKPFVTEELILKCDFQVRNYINILQNKQKEKALEKALLRTKEAEEYKAMFLANMSHEIRTPLNAIIGFNDLLIDKEKDEESLKYLSIMKESSKLLLGLINDILDFSKIESNKLDITKEVFQLNDIKENIISLYENTIEQKGLKLTIEMDKELPKYFYSDFLRIKQIITNLISNAIKFTPTDGEIIFSIKYSDNNKFIEISVQDNGIGIDPTNHQKIFDMFSQADSKIVKKFGGTGLGLTISSRLVTMLGGNIGVQSQLEKGSKFYFTLPIEQINENDIKSFEEKQTNINCENTNLTFDNHILLVEDNKVNQMFMKVMIQKFGLTFDIADDGQKAVDMYKQNQYDLILMDENMPNMNGSEATQIIRKYEKENNVRHIPIIALTANAIKGDREKFLQTGMNEYLAKPIDKVKLSEVLTEFLNDDKILTMCDPKDETIQRTQTIYEDFFQDSKEILDNLEQSIDKENFDDIKIYADMLKAQALKFKLQEIFTACLKIKKSAKEKDIVSCLNYLYLIKNL